MLFSVQDYKTRFGISGTDLDQQIYALSRSVSAAADRWCHRVLENDGTETTEYHDGSGTPFIALDRPPIISITSLHIDEDRVWDSTSLIPAADYVYRAGSGVITYLAGTFGCVLHSVRVVYRGGFQSIPEDLKEAAMLWGYHMQSHKPGVTSETIGTYSATYEQAASGAVPREVKTLLGAYIRPTSGRRM